ncbi:FAD-binding protein [Chloroflexota bacterium]
MMIPNREWDEETDVIVVGYGLSGAISAIEAHDADSKVILLEKGEYPGGISILAGGGLRGARDIDAASDYLTQTSGGRVAADMIHEMASGLMDVERYVRKLAEVNQATVKTPEAETGAYPFRGRDTFYAIRIAEVPGFKTFPWVQRLKPSGVYLMKVVMDNVETRRIRVMTSTPAKKLITDNDNRIIGIIAESQGKELTIKANRAVILASGGFEQNPWLKMQYLQGTPFHSMAPLTHTGDGILMAQKVGAALWHMWHLHGSYGFKFDEFPIAFRIPLAGARNPKRIMPWIVVDKSGCRYMNECQPAPQDTGHRAMEILDPDMPGYPRIPSYVILDEVGRKRGPIAQPLSVGKHIYEWSEDNLQEIDRGWILRENTIRELALKIKETADNESMMTPETLENTVSQWNEHVRQKQDPLHRPDSTMMPIEVPPFYAVPAWPVISNTQGGPVHNEKQQVLDAFGQPIPRLYAVGELGSFWSHLYLLGGNLSECLISGRTAGQNAAAETAG